MGFLEDHYVPLLDDLLNLYRSCGNGLHKQVGEPAAMLEDGPTVLTHEHGGPRGEETAGGRLAGRGALDVLEEQVRDAGSRGAELLVGGARTPDSAGNFFQPTLLAGVPNEAAAMQEESFGPILPVLAVSGDEEALTYMRDTRFGLTASIWTSDQERAEHFASSLDAGTIFNMRTLPGVGGEFRLASEHA